MLFLNSIDNLLQLLYEHSHSQQSHMNTYVGLLAES